MMGMDVQFMPMETPPNMADKQTMPEHHMCQPIYDGCMLKADDYTLGMPIDATFGMPMDAMLPHRLFDSSPEKSEQGQMLDSHSSNSIESSDGVEAQAPVSPRPRGEPQDGLGPLMSPPVRCLASPTPTTPKRPCYVPETPSPDRMHWLHQQPTMPYGLQQAAMPGGMPYGLAMQPAPLGGLPCYYGAQAHDQVMPPEFLPMVPSMIPVQEAAHFGELA